MSYLQNGFFVVLSQQSHHHCHHSPTDIIVNHITIHCLHHI